MLTPEGCIYIELDTLSIKNTVYIKKLDIKQVLLIIIVQHLINQNPSRGREI